MSNLTLTIDDELLKRARIRALEQDTSVNALVREYLEGLAGQAKSQDAIRAVLELAERSDSGSGPGGRTWTRDELYER
jgi:plasmid stability protein